MTLPAGWTAETETVDRIRLEVPVADREKAGDWLDEHGYLAFKNSGPAGWSNGEPSRFQQTFERPSRSVPVDELLAWLAGALVHNEDRRLVQSLREEAAEKWGER